MSQLVVKVLDGLLEDGRRNLWKLDLAELCLSEATCGVGIAKLGIGLQGLLSGPGGTALHARGGPGRVP